MSSRDYERVEEAIRYLQEHFREQPPLKKLASHVGLSEYHFQRLFQRWAGISPKRFLQFLTIEYAKQRLSECASVLDATLDAGLSSPSRMHDLFITMEAVTPGEYKRFGAELQIGYGFHDTPFGEALVAVTERGICGLEFVVARDREEPVANLQSRWGLAAISHSPRRTAPLAKRMFDRAGRRGEELRVLVKGTNFQVRVWEALLRIPPGTVVSYGTLARQVCTERASRAVGNAVAQNTVGYLIPCHRAIQSNGIAHRYRWGTARKKAMLGWEAAVRERH